MNPISKRENMFPKSGKRSKSTWQRKNYLMHLLVLRSENLNQKAQSDTTGEFKSIFDLKIGTSHKRLQHTLGEPDIKVYLTVRLLKLS